MGFLTPSKPSEAHAKKRAAERESVLALAPVILGNLGLSEKTKHDATFEMLVVRTRIDDFIHLADRFRPRCLSRTIKEGKLTFRATDPGTKTLIQCELHYEIDEAINALRIRFGPLFRLIDIGDRDDSRDPDWF